MRKIKIVLFIVAGILSSVPALSCTSVIINSKASGTGRPIMFKHRDTDDLNNRIGWFRGPKYTFIGLENASTPGSEVWTGTNSVGFSIMNTASYNIKNDDVPDDMMDQEGALMFKALGSCANTADFEELLDNLPRPMGVEANFGVIDAQGGAAYYEVNNDSWVKFDVNDPSVAPDGYRVVTNFSTSGRKEDYMGYERYLTASAIMKEIHATVGISSVDHSTLLNSLSRSYRHEYLGVDYTRDYDKMLASGYFNGKTVDQDFIPRRITSAQLVIEGVKPGEDPKHTVMWTLLGYPSSSVALPLMVGNEDILPSYVKKSEKSTHAEISDFAMEVKMKNIFPEKISNGKNYIDLQAVLKGSSDKPALRDMCLMIERDIVNPKFKDLFDSWCSGKISESKFYQEYSQLMEMFFESYKTFFKRFI